MISIYTVLPSSGVFSKWPQQQRLVQCKAKKLELSLGLPHGGTKDEGHPLMRSQAH